MTPVLNVPADLYAAIWREWKEGDKDEIDILRRKFEVNAAARTEGRSDVAGTEAGFFDPRFRVRFEEGAEIYRHYLGKDYRARAEGGSWVRLDTGERAESLNELSRSIGATTENAWMNWLIDTPNRTGMKITDLRDQHKIVRRRRKRI